MVRAKYYTMHFCLIQPAAECGHTKASARGGRFLRFWEAVSVNLRPFVSQICSPKVAGDWSFLLQNV